MRLQLRPVVIDMFVLYLSVKWAKCWALESAYTLAEQNMEIYKI